MQWASSEDLRRLNSAPLEFLAAVSLLNCGLFPWLAENPALFHYGSARRLFRTVNSSTMESNHHYLPKAFSEPIMSVQKKSKLYTIRLRCFCGQCREIRNGSLCFVDQALELLMHSTIILTILFAVVSKLGRVFFFRILMVASFFHLRIYR